MSRFKVVFMDFDAEAVPDWVPTALAEAGIDFAAHKCRTSTELAEYAATRT